MSEMQIQVGTHQVMELDDGHGDGGDQKMVISAPTWKKRKKKTKWAQGKGIKPKAILFYRSRRNRVCDRVQDR